MRRLLSVALCGVLLSAPGAIAQAQEKAQQKGPAGKKARDEKPPGDPAEGLLLQVRGPEAGAIEAAAALLALGTPRATGLLLDEMAVGLPPKVAAAALTALGPKNDPQAIDVLMLYGRDRNPELRKLAVVALSGIREGRVVPTLIAALSDPNADVRAAAAQGLGERKEKSAEPQLLKLLVHKDSFAPAALGQIGGPETARTLGEMVGNIPDRLVIETLGAFLQRKDFGPDTLRLEVVKTLSKLPGNEAVDALSDYVKGTAKEKTLPSRVEAVKIIEQRTAK